MPGYCRIVTWQGEALCIDASSGLPVSIGTMLGRDGYRILLACIPNTAPEICFLHAQSVPVAAISLAPNEYRSLVQPVEVKWVEPGRLAALRHPATRAVLSAQPIVAPDKPAAIGFSHRVEQSETFELVGIPEGLVPAGVQDWADTLERLLAHPPSAEAVLEFVEYTSSRFASVVLDAVLPLLTVDDLRRIARKLLAAPSLLARLAALMPDDNWASLALPRLAEWLVRDRRQPRSRRFQLPPEFDDLAYAGFRGRFASFGHACSAYARATVAPRRSVCIIATARNEGVYLLEWLAWHRGLGIEEFFLYSNDNTDGSDELLDALAQAGIVTWIHNQVGAGGGAQPKAYGHAFGMLPDVLDFRWALVIDLDEFLVLNPALFESVGDFARWHERRAVDAIALNWVMVGSGGEGVWRDAPVMQRFRRLLAPQSDLLAQQIRQVKTMCRPQRFIHSWPHFPITDDRRSLIYRLASGDLHLYRRDAPLGPEHGPAFSDRPNTDYACVYHYFYKSAEEFVWKFSRNRGDSPNSSEISANSLDDHFVHWFMGQHETTEFVIENRMWRWEPNFEAELAKLLALPNVAEANRHVQHTFRSHMREVKQGLRASPAIRNTHEVGSRFLEAAGAGDG